MTEKIAVSWRDPRMIAAILLAAMAGVVAAAISPSLAPSADLLAVWVAGQFWHMDRLQEIYPAAGPLFAMLPPDGWVDWLAQTQDYHASVYPFLYPPLWAVVMGALAPHSYAPVAAAALWVNAALLAGTVVLAIRATDAVLHPVVHVGMVAAIFLLTQIASVGYLQGQPHILVAFLIVLAIERNAAGAGRAAGVALALAASIKLFPAIYAVIWIARGEKRALVSFALAGVALAGASVALAGWPLNRAFLDSVGQIGRTLLMTGKNVSFDALIGQFAAMHDALLVRGPNPFMGTDRHEAWLIAPRPALWGVVTDAALLALLVVTGVVARRAGRAALFAGLWPMLLTLSALFAPTGWLYYMIPSAVFAPVLIARLPVLWGWFFFLAGLLFFWGGRLVAFQDLTFVPIPEVTAYVAGALLWSAGFATIGLARAGD